MVKTVAARDTQIAAEVGKEYFLTPGEGRRQFDAAVRARLGISGEEFIHRYEAGDYDDIADREGSRHIGHLIGLIAFARQDR